MAKVHPLTGQNVCETCGGIGHYSCICPPTPTRTERECSCGDLGRDEYCDRHGGL